jgi:hypothetical protein
MEQTKTQKTGLVYQSGDRDAARQGGADTLHKAVQVLNSVFGKAKPAGSDTRNQPHLDGGKDRKGVI